jgi:hypothetical protein
LSQAGRPPRCVVRLGGGGSQVGYSADVSVVLIAAGELSRVSMGAKAGDRGVM